MGKTAVKERKPVATVPAEIGTCRHHWIIDSPHGTLSEGRCKLCGEERQFRNSANDYIWDDDSTSSGYSSWSGARSGARGNGDGDVSSVSGSAGRGRALTL